MKKYYVYALSWDNKTKIGYTSNPNQRFGCLCSQAGVKQEDATFSFYETIKPRIAEKSCHVMAEKSYERLAGEWFNCSHAQAISIIISNVMDGLDDEPDNPELEVLISDIKSKLMLGVSLASSSDFNLNTSEFGNVTVIKIDGDNWFILSEILELIEYKASPSVMIDRINDVYRSAGIKCNFHSIAKIATNGGAQKKIIINEQGLFEVLLFSKNDKAFLFRQWVISNILI